MQHKVDSPVLDSALARRLEIAVHSAEMGIWEWDLRTGEFRYSDRAKEIFGFGKNDPVTRETIIATLHPADHRIAREQAERGLDPSLKKRDPYRYRIHRANDGELRWIHAFGEPEFETAGGKQIAVRYVGTLQDVTDEMLAKEQIVQQEARFRLAIEASGIAVWELNLADQTITHSPELNQLCGFPPEAHPTLEEFRSRYAPGERERIEREGAELRARGETRYDTEIHQVWPDGTHKWLSLRAQLAPGETSYDGRVIGVLVDITAQKQREEQQTLLVSEFKHRLKNSFAIMQSIMSQTLRGENVSEEIRSKLFARLKAMSDAHDLIAKGAWEGACLAAIVQRTVQTFHEGESDRVQLQADDVQLTPHAALSFALVLHELFTNATKYGALSNASGRVHIDIGKAGGGAQQILKFKWTESGGPPVSDQSHAGFGTRLIDHICAAGFAPAIKREFRSQGLLFTMEIPLAQLSEDSAA